MEIKTENKLCWFCEHFMYSAASPDYSEVTPGEDFNMTCLKRHWKFSAFNTSQREFGKMLMSARNCLDFVPLKSLTEKSK
jgi:hypothetical protein